MTDMNDIITALDEEVMDYLVGLAGDSSAADFSEAAAGMLLSQGAVPDEAAAEAAAASLWAALGGDSSEEKEQPEEPELTLLSDEQRAARGQRAAAASASAAAPAEAEAPAQPEQQQQPARQRKRKGKNARRKQKAAAAATAKSDEDSEPTAQTQRPAVSAMGVPMGTSQAAMQAQAVAELNDLDDWASAWQEAKETGREWGGRGFGGRGVHRATYQPRDVCLEGVTLQYHGADLLMRTTLRLMDGRRYGLVGKNGCGKTTLLRRIATQTLPGFPLHLKVALVAQEVEGTSMTPVETVLASHTEMHALQAEAAEIEAAGSSSAPADDLPPAPPALDRQSSTDRLVEIYDRLEELEADAAEGRAASILAGLGFTEAKRAMPTEQLSGGWRMRVALACALFIKPDLLMLDEPSNHLDLEAVVWLQDYLQSYDGTVLVVSHDRAFLNEVTTDTIHFHLKQLHYYPGNFQAFQHIRDNQQLKRQRQAATLEQKKQHLRDSIRRMETASRGKHGDQKKANLVASRRKKLMRTGLEENENGHRFRCQYGKTGAIREGADNANSAGFSKGGRGQRRAVSILEPTDPEVRFALPACEPLGVAADNYLTLTNVTFGYPGAEKPVLRDVSMAIGPGTRLALVGANGSGKTTLINLMVGELEPSAGEVWRHPGMRVSYFSQHFVDQLDLTKTPIQHLADRFSEGNEGKLRGHLSKFGITPDLAIKPLSSLSGGQKSRVLFADITYRPPHLLFLDEPTNHLDYKSIDALLEAVKAFEGAIVFVSHDQNLLAEGAEELWEVRRRRVTRWEGTWETYRESLARRLRSG